MGPLVAEARVTLLVGVGQPYFALAPPPVAPLPQVVALTFNPQG